MADNKFYQGFKRDQVRRQFQAVQGPDVSQAYRNIEQDKQVKIDRANQTIGSLEKLGQAVIKTTDTYVQEKARQEGIREAQQDLQDPNNNKRESSASMWSWGGKSQRDAYNNLRVQTELVDFPDAIESYISQDKENNGKALDEMTNNERSAAYQRAKQRYFSDRGINNSGYLREAEEYATKLEAAHLPQLQKQAETMREAKATEMIGTQLTAVARKLNDPVAINDYIKNMRNNYSQAIRLPTEKGQQDPNAYSQEELDNAYGALGSKSKTDAAILKGLMETIIKDPTSNLNAVNYLKSKEAKEEFGYMPDFEETVKRVDKLTIESRNKVKAEREEEAINNYYRNLNTGGFSNEDSLKDFLNRQEYLSEKQKYDLYQSGSKAIREGNEAYNLKSAYDNKELGVINSQKKEVQLALFKQEVGDLNKFQFGKGIVDVNSMKALVSHSNNGFKVPDEIVNFFDAKTTNPSVLKNQLDNIVRLRELGMQDLTSVIPKESIQRLELFAKYQAEGTDMKEMKLGLQKYDEFVNGIGSAEIWSNVDKTWKDNEFGEEITDWAIEGGNSGMFSSEMQPLLTFSDMSKEQSKASLNYAQQEIRRSYARNIYAGDNPETAIQKAKDEFKSSNNWEEFGNTQVYIPKFFNRSAKDLMDYVANDNQLEGNNGRITNILSDIMSSKNLDFNNKDLRKSVLENKVSVQAASDYSLSRRMEVYYDGAPTGYYISKNDMDKFSPKDKTLTRNKEVQKATEAVKEDVAKKKLERETKYKLELMDWFKGF